MWNYDFLVKGKQILNSLEPGFTPEHEKVLNFLEMDFNKIRIVILGQDPYPTKGLAIGRAFAVKKGSKIPQSLKNIFKEIEKIQGKVYTDETLDLWEKQGVLLLNTALTTIIGIPNSHKNIWHEYTKSIIKFIAKNKNVKWVLWGKEAQKMFKYINKDAIIIIDAHPSPLSVRHRNENTFKMLKEIKW